MKKYILALVFFIAITLSIALSMIILKTHEPDQIQYIVETRGDMFEITPYPVNLSTGTGREFDLKIAETEFTQNTDNVFADIKKITHSLQQYVNSEYPDGGYYIMPLTLNIVSSDNDKLAVVQINKLYSEEYSRKMNLNSSVNIKLTLFKDIKYDTVTTLSEYITEIRQIKPDKNDFNKDYGCFVKFVNLKKAEGLIINNSEQLKCILAAKQIEELSIEVLGNVQLDCINLKSDMKAVNMILNDWCDLHFLSKNTSIEKLSISTSVNQNLKPLSENNTISNLSVFTKCEIDFSPIELMYRLKRLNIQSMFITEEENSLKKMLTDTACEFIDSNFQLSQ